MKNDFKKMEDEMDHLATNMSTITEFSGNISTTLQDRRQEITKLSGVHSLLKRVRPDIQGFNYFFPSILHYMHLIFLYQLCLYGWMISNKVDFY
jgi:hypothetical protein